MLVGPEGKEATMSQLGMIDFILEGGVGGAGLSRQHFQRTDLGTITSSDAGAAAAAYRELWFTVDTYMPNTVGIGCGSNCAVHDDATGAPIAEVTLSAVPGFTTGGSGAAYAAGSGVRINWKTSTVRNRRFIRGATFLVPMTSACFDTTGYVASGPEAIIVGAASAYLAAMTAANIAHVAWHRPAKGTFIGGVAAPVTTFVVQSMPGQLKSRRS